ncbi:hypothetical protein BIW11_10288 [Tropilaelaps mercedesae]|uniref:Uncharacterized protein n=1 Tax=Tropilaelaps mercedesae TaxID=418985 RepID=A0A1V9XGN9_9ACAR|nr:hypothetical protein BIW11_10288 [Tropilaelaps mercedesae]
MLALVCLSGSAFVGLIHTYWRISDQSFEDKPLLMAVEFLDGYMAFSQAAVILMVYAVHSKYYARAKRIIFAWVPNACFIGIPMDPLTPCLNYALY